MRRPYEYRRAPLLIGLAVNTVGLVVVIVARLVRGLEPYMIPLMVVGLAIMAAGSLYMLRARPRV